VWGHGASAIPIHNKVLFAISANLGMLILLAAIALAAVHLMDSHRIFISIEMIGLAAVLGTQGGIIYRLLR